MLHSQKTSALFFSLSLGLVAGLFFRSTTSVHALDVSTDDTAGTPTIVDATETMQLNLNIGSYLGLDCQDVVNLGLIYAYGDSTAPLNCSVLTNNITGYQVTASAVTSLSSGPAQIQPLSGPAVLKQSATGSRWAINSNSAAVLTDATWRTNGLLWSGNYPTAATGEDHQLLVGLSVGQQVSQQPGSYSGTITLTLTAI